MIKNFNDFKMNENNRLSQNISREDAADLLFQYYNKCMDEFNGSVSEEAIYMLLNEIYGEEE